MTEQFLVLIEALLAAYRKEPTEALLASYWIGLDDLPLKDVTVAVKQAMRECEFLPTVKEIRERVCGKPEDVAELAFAALSKNVRAYQSVDFEDRAINAAVRHLGGMQRLWDMTEDEFNVWYRKEFLRVYAMYQRRGVSEEAGRPLLGIFDAANKNEDNLLRIGCDYSLPAKQLQEQQKLVLKKA